MNSLPSWNAPRAANENYVRRRARDSQEAFQYLDENAPNSAISAGPDSGNHLTAEGKQAPLIERRGPLPVGQEIPGLLRFARTQFDEPEVRVNTEQSPFVGRLTGPVKFLTTLLESWHLSEHDATILLGFEPREISTVRNILRGAMSMRGNDTRERVNALFDIRKTLDALLRDESVERGWLREGKDLLHGKAPMDLMLGGSFEDLLLVRDFVLHVAGKL